MASCAAENDLILFDHDLNDTVEYEDLSMTMETSNSTNSVNLTCSNKRFRSESRDSDSSEISMKKHIPIHENTPSLNQNMSSDIQIVFAESAEVDLSKVNPI